MATGSRNSSQPITAAKTGAAARRNSVVAVEVRDRARMYSIDVHARMPLASQTVGVRPEKSTGPSSAASDNEQHHGERGRPAAVRQELEVGCVLDRRHGDGGEAEQHAGAGDQDGPFAAA